MVGRKIKLVIQFSSFFVCMYLRYIPSYTVFRARRCTPHPVHTKLRKQAKKNCHFLYVEADQTKPVHKQAFEITYNNSHFWFFRYQIFIGRSISLIDFDEVNEENYADKSVCPFKTATIINEFVLNDLSVNTNIGSLNKQTTDRNIQKLRISTSRSHSYLKT